MKTCNQRVTCLRFAVLTYVYPYEFLKNFISFDCADKTSCAVVTRNVGRVFRHEITCHLTNGVMALFFKGVVDL